MALHVDAQHAAAATSQARLASELEASLLKLQRRDAQKVSWSLRPGWGGGEPYQRGLLQTSGRRG
ncbi:hypothetical protein [Synechococcus sp. CBW1004]|uniref:hypothetical protein n=1 Tax=Synechococcus sp. CBW1004 TaxID=1353136 RepID=UPI001E3DF6F8|nr:hypothetical protein [Synechococcus sp. CBW1004]